MADDQSQRPYRASEPPPARSAGKPSGNDPLAELARLIGQTDPFAEFGRDNARRAAAPQPSERTNWDTQPLGTGRSSQFGDDQRLSAPSSRYAANGYYASPSESEGQPSLQDYAGQNYARQSYGGAPLPGTVDQYPVESDPRAYPPGADDYQQVYEDAPQVNDAYYEDAPPSRRRLGIMAVASVLVLAVIGTAGAFGYRALFGSSVSSKPPPVIKADAGPSKIVPAPNGKDAQSSKLITDRVNDRGQSEKLVSREEQPLDKPATVVMSQSVPQPVVGSGVLASEPKKIRTIAIHPDQSVVADAGPPAGALAAAAPVRPASPPAPRPAPPIQTARAAPPDNATADSEPDVPPAPAPRPAAPARPAAHVSSNAPLSLNPSAAPTRAPAAARPVPAPTRTASVPSQTAHGAGSFVQVSSQRSEAEAQAAFRSLQAKFPNQLGGRSAQIHKADLGAKGTYYRAMVGPFASAAEAGELCSSLKAAGGQCLIQRN